MKLLAVDTSTESCGVAIADGEDIVASAALVSGITHSRRLLSLVHDLLDRSGLSLADLDGFAVTVGPGSFTGLRIGISTVKGLAVALGKPVAPVSTLEALAWQFANCDMLICPMIDARKGQVYAARYRFESGEIKTVLPQSALSPKEAALGIDEPCIFVGSGAGIWCDEIVAACGENAVFPPPFQNHVKPCVVAWLGASLFDKSLAKDPAEISPVYIRKPDAVIGRNKKI